MNNRTRKIVLVVVALLIGGIGGGIAGGYVAIKFTTSFLADAMMFGYAVDAKSNIGALKFIHQGDYEKATEILETSLDSKIIGLSESDDFTNKTNTEVVEAFQRARNYRTDYPRNSGSGKFDKAVEEILEQANQQ